MERKNSLMTLVLLCSLAVISWPALNAKEAESNSSELKDADTVVTISKLLDRIETLEKRIEALENQNTVVRLVDSRNEVESNVLPQIVPKPANDDEPTSRKLPAPPLYLAPFSPSTPTQQDQDDETQRTNGQKWRFHFLKNRPILESSSKIY